MDLSFYKGKRVLVTGHTGFKGSWLCRMLVNAGAKVTGYSLQPPTEPNLFTLADIGNGMASVIGDIRNFAALQRTFAEIKPQIVFHLAAQPIVRESYRIPRETYETNVMGTVNLMECVRLTSGVKSVVNVTTDKVYQNREWYWGYREDEPLDGFDPYSNSKSCSELVTHSYIRSFFSRGEIAVSTVRAGNVIGGGDFAPDRIIPDCVRSVTSGEPIKVRSPDSVRPYQYVLEPLAVYLEIAKRQFSDISYAGFYNVGPDDNGCVSTGNLAELFCECWGDGARWETAVEAEAPHEANFLKLDCSKLKTTFGWRPKLGIRECMEHTVGFYKNLYAGKKLSAETDRAIVEFLKW